MNEPPENLPATKSLADLLEPLELDEDVVSLTEGSATCEEASQKLESRGLYAEAVLVLARGMSAKNPVQWILHCLEQSEAEDDPEIVGLVTTWIGSDSNEKKPEFYNLALDRKHKTPAAWMALTAYWCGPSVAPPDSPDVPPDPHLTAVGTQGAIALCAVEGEAKDVESRFQKYLALGREILAQAP